jgi:hypothetical protein
MLRSFYSGPGRWGYWVREHYSSPLSHSLVEAPRTLADFVRVSVLDVTQKRINRAGMVMP